MSTTELTALAVALAKVAKEHNLKLLRAGGVEVQRWPDKPEEPAAVGDDERATQILDRRQMMLDDWSHAGAMPKGAAE